VRTVRASQVVVISGETGCGKTTQVPQFLIDDALHSGKYCVYCVFGTSHM
jgi:HrpA-like RNA helicase